MKKTQVGTIISDKMINTVVVKVETYKVHPKYRKRFKSSKNFKADTEGKVFSVGDKVVIEESRPLSKDKCWKVSKKVEGKEEAK